MKKNMSALLLTGFILLSLTVPAAAVSATIFEAVPRSAQAVTKAAPRAEETQWYYRVFNGKKQMRLWSITEGKWLTEWIDVNP